VAGGPLLPGRFPLWRSPAAAAEHDLSTLVRRVFARHLTGHDRSDGQTWGWKLCETAYILPVLDYLFPDARYIHLIRDGRDVAFCDHVGANDAFWRKIYFNTDRIRRWRSLRLNLADYRLRSHVYNALHWANSVTVGRHYGMMLRHRYLEVKYEDLCRDFVPAVERLLEFLGLAHRMDPVMKLAGRVYATSVGKHLAQPRRKVRRVVNLIKPQLVSFGYLADD